MRYLERLQEAENPELKRATKEHEAAKRATQKMKTMRKASTKRMLYLSARRKAAKAKISRDPEYKNLRAAARAAYVAEAYIQLGDILAEAISPAVLGSQKTRDKRRKRREAVSDARQDRVKKSTKTNDVENLKKANRSLERANSDLENIKYREGEVKETEGDVPGIKPKRSKSKKKQESTVYHEVGKMLAEIRARSRDLNTIRARRGAQGMATSAEGTRRQAEKKFAQADAAAAKNIAQFTVDMLKNPDAGEESPEVVAMQKRSKEANSVDKQGEYLAGKHLKQRARADRALKRAKRPLPHEPGYTLPQEGEQ